MRTQEQGAEGTCPRLPAGQALACTAVVGSLPSARIRCWSARSGSVGKCTRGPEPSVSWAGAVLFASRVPGVNNQATEVPTRGPVVASQPPFLPLGLQGPPSPRITCAPQISSPHPWKSLLTPELVLHKRFSHFQLHYARSTRHSFADRPQLSQLTLLLNGPLLSVPTTPWKRSGRPQLGDTSVPPERCTLRN